MVARAVFLYAAGEVEGETQWSVRLGETCRTELDVVQSGQRTTINGGVAGGWFGWGARQDGPLQQGGRPPSQHTEAVHCHLTSSSISDSQIEKFNKEFIAEEPVYRSGLCDHYTFKLLALLAGPSHLLHSLLTLKQEQQVEQEQDEQVR